MGQPLHDGGLADAGSPDQHRIVFGLAGQNADHIPNLVVSADHRIRITGTGGLDQVGAVFFQGFVVGLGVGGPDMLTAPEVIDQLFNLGRCRPLLNQKLGQRIVL